MSIEIEELRAWIDGELGEQQAKNVAKVVENDTQLQQYVEQLRASQLPYKEAFELTNASDVPDELAEKIDSLLAASNATSRSTDSSTKNKSAFPAILAITGMLVAAIVGFLIGGNVKSNKSAETLTTVEGTLDNNVSALSKRLEATTDLTLQVPQLEGYRFIRAQQLSFNGEPLVQLVYLGDTGVPLALCFMNNRDDNPALTLGTNFGLQTAEWVYAGKRFVIVSDASESQLKQFQQATIDQWNS